MKLRTLTLMHPWAQALAAGVKDVENRSQETRYRGPFLIHAGMQWWSRDREEAERMARRTGRVLAFDRNGDGLAFGAIIGVAILQDVVWDSPSPWALPGQAHWEITGAQAFARAFPQKGSQGWWYCEASRALVAAVRDAGVDPKQLKRQEKA